MLTFDVADGEDRVEACLALARSVEAGFNDHGLAQMADALPDQRTLLAYDGATDDDGRTADDLVGFASVAEKPDAGVRELAWLAVAGSRWREGIGSRLVEALVDDCREREVALLTVKTLADTVEDEHYEGVREFYAGLGFRHVETIDPYPPWGPENPCAIYVRVVGGDR